MKLGIEALPTARVKPVVSRLSRYDRQFGDVAFGVLAQLVLPPLQPLELFLDDPLGLGLRVFSLQFASVILA
jgi:hypothetical protein